jgi:hypothetical protein
LINFALRSASATKKLADLCPIIAQHIARAVLILIFYLYGESFGNAKVGTKSKRQQKDKQMRIRLIFDISLSTS